MKKFKLSLILTVFFIILVYICKIDSIPSSIILLQGEKLEIDTILGMKIEYEKESIEVSNNNQGDISSKTGKTDLNLKLGDIPVKDITVNVIPNKVVIPGGETIGLKLYTNGVLVVGMSEIEGIDKQSYKPYENSGIEEGDMIVGIENEAVTCTADLIKNVNASLGKNLEISYIREGEMYKTNILPTQTSINEYKLGLWVRDAAAGVGTVSFYDPETGMFAALGHGILDIDTEKIVNISSGEVVTSNIISIVKGQKGRPGEIRGSIEKGKQIGTVYENTEFGIFGKLNSETISKVKQNKEIEILPRAEIETGRAKIICTVENNRQEEYDIEIEKVFRNNNVNNKSMLIKVTDERLIEKTGGIIQGMSGSPIIQNGKFVGAITHVMVNDPTIGYGVFADMMLKQMREVK